MKHIQIQLDERITAAHKRALQVYLLAKQVEEQLLKTFKAEGYYNVKIKETVYLLVYCMYWWRAFAHGYAFEIEILRDLESLGLPLTAHDARDRAQRYTPSDLIMATNSITKKSDVAGNRRGC